MSEFLNYGYFPCGPSLLNLVFCSYICLSHFYGQLSFILITLFVPKLSLEFRSPLGSPLVLVLLRVLFALNGLFSMNNMKCSSSVFCHHSPSTPSRFYFFISLERCKIP